MHQIIIGTAGHIDHGKTALVKALTGMDTDRLPEEKERGMTIDLGFAFLTDDITIIDVPGHEKFIRNMVAGVSTIDIALITVAADDGIMPQTREHVDILRLLGIKFGCFVITKIDLVEDSDWLDLLEEDIRDYAKDSFFENTPIVRVSSETGEGVEEVRSILIHLAGQAVEKRDRGFFRLFVDRVFTMKGFGTVVTGTVVSGCLNEGDGVEILPRGGVSKVRGLQTHGLPVPSVYLGDRAALNLSNVDKSVLKRGSQLASKGFLKPTSAIGAEISLLPQTNRIIRHQQRVRVHLGTDEVMGKVFFVRTDQKKLNPGETSMILIKLEKDAAVAIDDPLIVRFYSPPETIGGGVIIDPFPPDRWKVCRSWLESLVGLNQKERLRKFLESFASEPLTLKEWCHRYQVSPSVFRQLIIDLQVIKFGSQDNPFVTLTSSLENQKRAYLEEIRNFHHQSPYKMGIARDSLRQNLGFSISLFDFLTFHLENEGKINVLEGLVRKHGFRIELNTKDQELANHIEEELKKTKFTPPSLTELATTQKTSLSKILQLMHILKNQGKAEEVEDNLWFHVDHLHSIEERIRNFFEDKSFMAVNDFKLLTKTTRKHAIPLLEYFDRRRLTQRDGNQRVLFS